MSEQEILLSTTPSTRDIPEVADSTANATISIVRLSKTFGTFKAIDDLSLTVQRGEIFGLLGPNGSGKTTTINIISGLSQPSTGTAYIMGYDVRTESRRIRQLLGAVPQETALYEELTAWDNLDFHADLFGLNRSEKSARIAEILELVQLTARQHTRVGTFSGGMKRRLALGRALLHRPQLLYLDEPTLGVDVQSRRAIWDHILAMRDQGNTVLITTNYLEEAQILCDRLAIIDHGTLLAVDTTNHLKESYGGSVVEMVTSVPCSLSSTLAALPDVQNVVLEGTKLKITLQGASNAVPHIVNLLAQEGEILDLIIREPNLDEVFLRLTGAALRD